MPQIKRRVPVLGPYPMLRLDVVRFTQKWPKVKIHESALEALTAIAIDPARARDFHLSRSLDRNPDFVLAVLQFIRRKWFPRKKSKSWELQKFLATEWVFQPLAHQKPRCHTDMHDDEIATGYTLATGQPAEVEDVVKARKALAARVERATEVLGEDFSAVVRGGKNHRRTFRLKA